MFNLNQNPEQISCGTDSLGHQKQRWNLGSTDRESSLQVRKLLKGTERSRQISGSTGFTVCALVSDIHQLKQEFNNDNH